MSRVDSEFKNRVYEVVSQIPKNKVMAYGQVAAMAGAAYAAWEVGKIAHLGPPDLPWQRVVDRNGGLARGYPGGMEGHKRDLETEGVVVSDDYQIDLEKHQWEPPHKSQNSLL